MKPDLYVGAMSGTSLDGVDAVLVDFGANGPDELIARVEANLIDTPGHRSSHEPRVLGHVHEPYPADLRRELLDLNTPGANELHRAAVATASIAACYGQAIHRLLHSKGLRPQDIIAAGIHGQTVRHRPPAFGDGPGGMGYSWQLDPSPALTVQWGIETVSDFRSQDIALGGQGAPLVPAFHERLFRHASRRIAVLNIGGIANVTLLTPGMPTQGFDTGPGNVLLDAWCARHTGAPFDSDGAWAESGVVLPGLLADWLKHPYFAQAAPKSTGRDDFHITWLDHRLARWTAAQADLLSPSPADVQSTLAELTAATVAHALGTGATPVDQVWVCGGGACNSDLMRRLARHLPQAVVSPTSAAGWPVDQMEAAAFAWLARCRVRGEFNTLPSVTGARAATSAGAWRRPAR